MSSVGERLAFSQRLAQALAQNGYAHDRSTTICREFNLRYRVKRITVYAVRKWLQGEAIPSQDKLQVLSEWLGVPIHWLRFGDAKTPIQNSPKFIPGSDRDVQIFTEFQKLDDHGKLIIEETIRSLLKLFPSQHREGTPQSVPNTDTMPSAGKPHFDQT